MQERKRLVADRFRRIWQVAEEIAHTPGQSRADLARTFCLSERQLQADMDILRHDMHLPLVRRGGYRFKNEYGSSESGPLSLNLRDALVVLSCMTSVAGKRKRHEMIDTTINKLAYAFPPHLQPLVRLASDAALVRTGGLRGVVLPLLDAMLRGCTVKLDYCGGPFALTSEPIVQPELLLPYGTGWLLIGGCVQRKGWATVFRLDAVRSVTVEAMPRAEDRVTVEVARLFLMAVHWMLWAAWVFLVLMWAWALGGAIFGKTDTEWDRLLWAGALVFSTAILAGNAGIQIGRAIP